MDKSKEKELLTLRLANRNFQKTLEWEGSWLKKIVFVVTIFVAVGISLVIKGVENFGTLVTDSLLFTTLISVIYFVVKKVGQMLWARFKRD